MNVPNRTQRRRLSIWRSTSRLAAILSSSVALVANPLPRVSLRCKLPIVISICCVLVAVVSCMFFFGTLAAGSLGLLVAGEGAGSGVETLAIAAGDATISFAASASFTAKRWERMSGQALVQERSTAAPWLRCVLRRRRARERVDRQKAECVSKSHQPRPPDTVEKRWPCEEAGEARRSPQAFAVRAYTRLVGIGAVRARKASCVLILVRRSAKKHEEGRSAEKHEEAFTISGSSVRGARRGHAAH